MSVDATSIRESLFQRIASLAKGQPVTHLKMWGTISYCKSKMRRFPKSIEDNLLLKIFWELKFWSWMTWWWPLLDDKLRDWTPKKQDVFDYRSLKKTVREDRNLNLNDSSALRARKRKHLSSRGDGCWSLKVSCCLWVNLYIVKNMKFTMSTQWCVHIVFILKLHGSDNGFSKESFGSSGSFTVSHIIIGFCPMDFGLWNWNMIF